MNEWLTQYFNLAVQHQRMKAAMEVLLQAQGRIAPGWNIEVLDADWVRQLAEQALGTSLENRGLSAPR